MPRYHLAASPSPRIGCLPNAQPGQGYSSTFSLLNLDLIVKVSCVDLFLVLAIKLYGIEAMTNEIVEKQVCQQP